jgi:AcrR family transcriptional regulator
MTIRYNQHMGSVKRAYHSEVRQRAAGATREAIVAAARALFASRGFAATSIDAIAREAGVATPTVYAVFGNKRAILRLMLDAIDEEAEVDALRPVLASGSIDEQREAIARFFGRLFTRGGDLIEASRSAGASDPELRAMTEQGRARHRREMRKVVDAWARAGALRKGLSARDAADALAAVTSYAVFADLQAAGWNVKKYERWVADAMARLAT